jgi:hypothetical protein
LRRRRRCAAAVAPPPRRHKCHCSWIGYRAWSVDQTGAYDRVRSL